MPLGLCPLSLVTALGVMGVALIPVMAYAVVEAWSWWRLSARTGLLACLLVADVVLTRSLEGVHALRRDNAMGFVSLLTPRLVRLPAAVLAVALMAMALAVGVTLMQMRRLRRVQITPDSVKEALDALPDGVCFAHADGTPVLVNVRMDMLSHVAFGMPLTDETVLWERLCAGDVLLGYEIVPGNGTASHGTTIPSAGASSQEGESSVQATWPVGRQQAAGEVATSANSPVLLTPEGAAWQFSRRLLTVEGAELVELIAADITQEYALVRELEERNRRLEGVNERLRAYGRDISRLTRDEEVLSAKVRVHDEVGRALIALRVYEQQEPGQRDRAQLIDLWRRVTSLLEGASGAEATTDEWELLCEAALAIDVRLELAGELPATEEQRQLVVMLVHECLNNAVRHGGAHTVQVACSTSDDAMPPKASVASPLRDTGSGRGGTTLDQRRPTSLRVVVTNDGSTPAATPQLTGGLAHVRSAVERAHGMLDVQWEPQVAVEMRME